jgi:spoIIIJ-associated protein
MEWLEAEGDSVDAAVQAALEELGLESAEQVDVEVLREPKKGFLGLGTQLALVKVTRKPSRRRRRRRGRSSRGSEGAGATDSNAGRSGASTRSGSDRGEQKAKRTNASGSSRGGQKPAQSDRSKSSKSRSAQSRSDSSQKKSRPSNKPNNGGKQNSRSKRPPQEAAVTEEKGQDREQASIEEQAQVAVEFLEGLVESFGLEGEVTSRIEDDVLYLNVDGDAEALVGSRGVIMQSVLELTRTVVQRKTYGAPRMRLDIAGYAERRREALTIYAGRLAEKVIADGGEVMLEPMNPADRKVVHDAIGAIDGVRSYSEGEDPNRSVVVAPAE